MIYLLDVNVLIALLDPLHVHHQPAYSWFAETGHRAWATSPIVENGVIRIVGNSGYTTVPFGCGAVADLLAEWCQAPGHYFWPEDISLLDATFAECRSQLSPKRITDIYLLALAVHHGGKLATFDGRLPAAIIPGGRGALHRIGE